MAYKSPTTVKREREHLAWLLDLLTELNRGIDEDDMGIMSTHVEQVWSDRSGSELDIRLRLLLPRSMLMRLQERPL